VITAPAPRRRSLFRTIRIAALLVILVLVAGSAWLTKVRTTSWERPLRVAIFPIAADDSKQTYAYINTLTVATFQPIADFMAREAGRYGLPLSTPVEVYLAPQIYRTPPPPPFGGNPIQVILWSLQTRYWAWVNADFKAPPPHVRMFVLYNDPVIAQRIGHSLGLQKGLIGVVNAYAVDYQTAENNVVIAHELLHTVGATDKYDPDSNEPRYPEGYAEPQRNPLLPQKYAELMAGRFPATSIDEPLMPGLLDDVRIGAQTAKEINWVR
jgi:hypothetical protein